MSTAFPQMARIPPSFISIGLHSRKTKLQLPLSTIVEEFKVPKCRLMMTLRYSEDAEVSEARVQSGTGRKWSASQALQQAEDMLIIRDIIGNICVSRQELRSSKFKQWQPTRDKISMTWCQGKYEEVSKNSERLRQSLGQQGACTRWNVPERKVTLSEL